MASVVSSSAQIDNLKSALKRMNKSTVDAKKCCNKLKLRSKHLNSLTSPASDASAMLSTAQTNISSVLTLMKDAQEKFDTISDCEPCIETLYNGIKQLEDIRLKNMSNAPGSDSNIDIMGKNKNILKEQDVYAASDSMDIIIDAHKYFVGRPTWKSTPAALGGLERIHTMGVTAMCMIIKHHLFVAGSAFELKSNKQSSLKGAPQSSKDKGSKKKGSLGLQTNYDNETAIETRRRLSLALQNRDLLKSIGEYEEIQPVISKHVRELHSVFECLCSGSSIDGWYLGRDIGKKEKDVEAALNKLNVPANQIVRTEKIGSGYYTNLTKVQLKVGYPHLNAYADTRRIVAYKSIDNYYRQTKLDRTNRAAAGKATRNQPAAGMTIITPEDADAAARDAVRCLEHAMIVVAGEKSLYKTVIGPSLVGTSRDDDEIEVSILYKKACVAAYSHVTATVVDRSLDIIESVFVKEGGIGHAIAAENAAKAANKASAATPTAEGEKSGEGGDAKTETTPAVAYLSVRAAASGAAAGLRMLDGVRMLGPSLAKLCDMQVEGIGNRKDGDDGKKEVNNNMTISSTLCIAIHRTTVKNCAKTLENLAKAIQEDPLNGEQHRPRDARIASVSSDVVRAIRLISPFLSAYKSVTKRRALPWDPNIGEEAGELDSYVRFLVMRLLQSLQKKHTNYTRDPFEDAVAKANMFMMNNTFYLLKELGPDGKSKEKKEVTQKIKRGKDGKKRIVVEEEDNQNDTGDNYRIDAKWFTDKVNNMFESEKRKYLSHWELLNSHLTSVDSTELEFQKDNILSLESGRLIKSRFSGFNDDFEKIYGQHKKFAVIDSNLRITIIKDVKNVFLTRYKKFYDKYSRIQFSKKNMEQYLKFPPQKIDTLLNDLYTGYN